MSGGLPLAISQLPIISSVTGAEIIPTTQQGVTGSVTPYSLISGASEVLNPISTYMFPMIAPNAGTYRSITLAQIGDYDNRYTAAGTANALTITTNPQYSALTDGMQFCIRATATNTGPATLQVNAIAPVTINATIGGNTRSLIGGEISSGQDCIFVWDAAASAAVLINPSASIGTFTGTGTGFTSSPTTPVTYIIQGGICNLVFTSVVAGTSNATTFTVTGGPSVIAPVRTQSFPCFITNSGTAGPGCVVLTASSSVISFGNGNSYGAGGFTASGGKNFNNGGFANVVYSLV